MSANGLGRSVTVDCNTVMDRQAKSHRADGQAFASPNQSVLAGVECLQWLATSVAPVGTREMARLMGIDPNRASRLLNSLAMAGLARKTPNRKFTVGNGFHALAAQSLYASGLLAAAIPALEPLSRFNAIVALGVLWRDKVSYLYYRHPNVSIAHAIGARALGQAAQSSIGHILLADQTPQQVRELYRGRPVPGYDSVEQLLDQLALARRQGYADILAFGNRRHMTLAVGIYQADQLIAAVACANYSPSQDKRPIIAALKQAAADISRAVNDAAQLEPLSLDAPQWQ